MNVAIIGVPYDLDRPRTGMGRAPEALLDAGLVRRLQRIGCAASLTATVEIPPSEDPRQARLGRLLARLGHEVAHARAAGLFPLIVGGDCMTALGTLAGLADSVGTGIAWFDAHGDFNTPETTLSGYLGGMPLACAVGRGLNDLRARSGLAVPVPERQVALLGARDLDPPEERALVASAVFMLRTAELADEAAGLNQALMRLRGVPRVYAHIDVDVLDPADAPGVDYPAPHGLRLAQLREAVRRVVGMGNVAALGVAAVNPEKDVDGRTVGAALDVMEAAMGTLGRAASAVRGVTSRG